MIHLPSSYLRGFALSRMQNSRPKEKGQPVQQFAFQDQSPESHKTPSHACTGEPSPRSSFWLLRLHSYKVQPALLPDRYHSSVALLGIKRHPFAKISFVLVFFGGGGGICFVLGFFFVCVRSYSGSRKQYWPKWNTSLGWSIYKLGIYLFKSFCYQT